MPDKAVAAAVASTDGVAQWARDVHQRGCPLMHVVAARLEKVRMVVPLPPQPSFPPSVAPSGNPDAGDTSLLVSRFRGNDDADGVVFPVISTKRSASRISNSPPHSREAVAGRRGVG